MPTDGGGWSVCNMACNSDSASFHGDGLEFDDAMGVALAVFHRGGYSWPEVWGDRP
jgi:hypothetical protein